MLIPLKNGEGGSHHIYVIDIAWQSVVYGLYSTELKGCSPKGGGYISCTALDRHAICIIYPKGGGMCPYAR